MKGEEGLQLHAQGLKQIVCVQIVQRRGTTVSYKIPDMEKAIKSDHTVKNLTCLFHSINSPIFSTA